MRSSRLACHSGPPRGILGTLASFATLTVLVTSPAWAQQSSAAPPRALTLGDAARLAVQQNAAAAVARLDVDQQAARARRERADLLPDLSASLADGEHSYNTASFGIPFPGFDPEGEIIGPVRTVDLRARVSMNLYDPVQRGEYRHAQAGTAQSEAEAAAAAERAAVAAANAYVRVQHAQMQLFGATMDSTIAQELLSIARDQLAAGIGVALDVTRAEAQAATIQLRLIARRNERDQARLQLLRALGIPLDSPVLLTDSLDTPVALPPAATDTALESRALARRPEARAAAAAVVTAERARATDRAYHLPTVSAFADNGFTSNTYTNLLNSHDYGVALSIPIFDSYKTRSRVEESSAALRAAEVRERDVREEVKLDVRTALVSLRTAQLQVNAARERLRLAQQELDQARERFRVGVTGNADVVTAQLALGQWRGELADALAALQTSRIALAAAEGTVTELP